ncbi:sulfatase-like hydrolase/transferase [Luteolibacter algae]|uniref:Sulfatase-like hydrolase/transferase n=1 Tax=Luteolibacter algae TaxID=454151 RepID=A0ABW5D3Z4_9BACT
MKKFLSHSLCCSLFIAGISIAGATAPNVVIIVPDDVSYNDFSFYNKSEKAPQTPHVDAFAEESVRLTDFHVAPTCSPTRAAIMTGRNNDGTGVWHTIMGRYFLRPNEVTMADIFKENGFATGLFGKWHLGDSYPFRPKDRGFQHTVMIHGGGVDQQPQHWGDRDAPPCVIYVDGKPLELNDENASIPGEMPASGAYTTNFFTTKAIEFMRRKQEKKMPFFAYIPYNVAHGPNDMPPDAREGVGAHTAVVENMDKNVGRILEFLDVSGLADDTIVFFFTDNGMNNSLLRGGKGSEYEGGHRVPCFVRWKKGGYVSAEVPRMTGAIDLLPTLMDVLRLKDSEKRSQPMEGKSLRTLLDTDPQNDDLYFNERVMVVDNQRLDELTKYKQASVMLDTIGNGGEITHKWRLMRVSGKHSWELYDVLSDPKQKEDLSSEPENKEIMASLEQAYEKWWEQVSSQSEEFVRLVLGSKEQEETCLYAHDWHTSDPVPWNDTHIAEALISNGYHAVSFARDGKFTFDLRRWPKEIGNETAVASKLATPIRVGNSGKMSDGVPLPIRSARIRIWQGEETIADERAEVAPASNGAVFKLDLPAGPAMVQTWFYDEEGKEICGAYYVYVTGK